MSISDYLEDGGDYYDIYGYDGDCNEDCENCEIRQECELYQP